jgi:predicted DNA binding CopG/RHH family protein
MEGKTERINIRVSADELQAIKAKADEKHLSVSAYIRMMILGGHSNDRA